MSIKKEDYGEPLWLAMPPTEQLRTLGETRDMWCAATPKPEIELSREVEEACDKLTTLCHGPYLESGDERMIATGKRYSGIYKDLARAIIAQVHQDIALVMLKRK